MVHSSSGSVKAGKFGERSVDAVYQRSQLSGWTFALVIPTTAALAASSRAAVLMALGLGGAIGVAFILSDIVSRRVAGPIAKLASAMESASRGQRFNALPTNPVMVLSQKAR